MAVEIQKLNQKNAIWQAYYRPWAALDLLCEGGIRLEAAAMSFLLKRPSEHADVYQERLKRFTSQNILGTVFGSYAAQLFRTEPQIEVPKDDWYEGFLKVCDRSKTSYVRMWSAIFLSMLKFGRAWVLVDMPSMGTEPPADRAEEMGRGLTDPYLIRYDPREVINWQDDDQGNLEWAVIRCQVTKEKFLEKPEVVTTWYFFDRENFRTFQYIGTEDSLITNMDSSKMPGIEKALADEIDSGRHSMADAKLVPLQKILLSDELWLGNRSYLQAKDHINQENEYVWGLRNSNLEMPVIYSDKDLSAPRIGEAFYLQLGMNDRFEWTGTQGKAAAESQKRLQQIIEEMYRALYLQSQGRTSAATPAMQSGFSKEMDRIPANDILNEYGDIMRSEMQTCLERVAMARKDKAAKFDVRGFRFETKSAMQTIAIAQQVTDLGIPSPTLEKELDKQVAEDVLQDANPDIKKKIVDEIEAAPTRTEQAQKDAELQTQAFQKSLQSATAKATVKSEEGALAA